MLVLVLWNSPTSQGVYTHYAFRWAHLSLRREDFRDRLRMSDLVVSGIILGTAQTGVRVVDGAKAVAHVASIRVDRVFQGSAPGRQLRFTWFSLYMRVEKDNGFAYSGPPLADFRPGKRYLLFLKRAGPDWKVAMPVYAIEEELAAAPPRGSVWDLSRATTRERYRALGEELENTALAQLAPPKGMSGEASTYFSSTFDLIGACAEHFYDRFVSSSSTELRKAAVTWLDLIDSRSLTCEGTSAQTIHQRPSLLRIALSYARSTPLPLVQTCATSRMLSARWRMPLWRGSVDRELQAWKVGSPDAYE